MQQQNNQSLKTFSSIDLEDIVHAPVGVQEKLRKRKGWKKTKIGSLTASNEPIQGSNAHTQTKAASKFPKPKVTTKKGTKKPKQVTSETKNSNEEDEEEQQDP
ncbi:MAG: hypothetical protein EZS28_052760 [Streblomastix strix]|uniref:Uncharacterized protein n=1 Tax=Streblomastix strix TaxID=222440 RepID=A0A5J4RV84_9EUKA|nr:MAG: hypothetical protein EZS28_052760 [Streblomastix strix]